MNFSARCRQAHGTEKRVEIGYCLYHCNGIPESGIPGKQGNQRGRLTAFFLRTAFPEALVSAVPLNGYVIALL